MHFSLMHFPRPLSSLAFSLGLLFTPLLHAYSLPPDSPVAAPHSLPLTLSVDASQIAQKMLHAQMSLPVHPGALSLAYPKWIPGEHGPTGPVDNIAGLVFSANGKTIPWRRDLQDMYTFHLTVPAGVHTLTARYDFLLSGDTTGFSASGLTTPNLVNINWNQLVLYPLGRTADNVTVTASLRLPTGWQYGTALPVKAAQGDMVSFLPAPLVTLVDSPVLAGKYFKSILLTAPGVTPPHEIDMVSDSAAALAMPETQIQHYKNLVAETGPLFGARHYRDYHFLYTLSSHVASFGLEHHESSDDRVGERTLLDPDETLLAADLLPHEFVHSWNGKYRRPYDLFTPDYQMPMRDDLLWVYEGMTEYYGLALTARSGLYTPEDYRDELANIAAYLDHETGRAWRPLSDTAVASQNLRASREWRLARRAQDYYTEMVLIWLEADTIIRNQTAGRKSLDDFARLFGGGQSGPPQVVTYTLDDIARTLSAVTPYDWRKFLQDRIYTITPRAPLGGIVSSGWTLVYTDTQSTLDKANEAQRGGISLIYSLGISLNKTGQIGDIVAASPGAQAGLAPGMKLIAVNGRRYTSAVLKTAVKGSKTATEPITLLVENGEFFKTCQINYHGGAQYPHLVRNPAKPDLLTAIVSPRTTAPRP